MSIVVVVLMVVANIVGAGMAIPQAVRLHRTRVTHGVSAVWVGVSISINLWWLVYGVVEQLWGLVPLSVVCVVVYGVVARLLLYLRGGSTAREIAVGCALGLAPLPFLVLGGWSVAGLAIGLCYGVQLAPAVLASFRTRDLGGVSPGTWLMALGESTIWLSYGIAVGDPALIAGGSCGVVLPAALLVRLVVTGHGPRGRTSRVTPPAWSIG